MGYKHSTAALGVPLKAPEKLILLVMSIHANATSGLSYPSVGTIAREAGLSERMVQRHLKSLVQKRVLDLISCPLSRTRRYQLAASVMAGTWELICDERGDTRSAADDTTGVTPMTLGGDISDTQKEKNKKKKQESKKGCTTMSVGKIHWPHIYCEDGIFTIPPRYDHDDDFQEAFREWFRVRLEKRGVSGVRASHLQREFATLDELTFEDALEHVSHAAGYGINHLVNERFDSSIDRWEKTP